MTPPVLAIVYLILSFLGALVVVQRLFPEFPALVRFTAAFLVGLVVSGWTTFAAASLLHSLSGDDATFYGSFITMAISAVVIWVWRRELEPAAFAVSPAGAAGAAGAVVLAGWVITTRLSGDPLTVSANTWGDTALHVGIARSFSAGDNYPPVLPIFAGETIRYHFGLDFTAGVLERLGLPLEWAFNLPGAAGFAAIMILLTAFAQYLWRSAAIGVIAAALFITNGSFAFLRYFDNYPSVLEALRPANWWNHSQLQAYAPYQEGEQISLFWTLQPYLSQTHLIVAVALVLLVVYALLRHLRGPGGIAGDPAADFTEEDRHPPLTRPRAVALGVLLGAGLWLNGIVFLTSMILIAVLFFVYSGHLRRVARRTAVLVGVAVVLFGVGTVLASDALRLAGLAVLIGGFLLWGPLRVSWPFFVAAGVVALPQLLWLKGGISTTNSLFFHSGYLVEGFRFDNGQSYVDLVVYWWLNLGLVLPLVVLAAVVGRRADGKLLVAIMAIFAFGNVASFGVDVPGHNHKVFNLWETMVNLYAAYGLVWLARRLWRGIPVPPRVGAVAGRAVAVVVVPVVAVVLVLSGLLDFMLYRNDPRYEVFGDTESAIAWIEASTSRDAVFLTADGDIYTVPTLAGRSVYLGGFSIWADGMGYDTAPRRARIAEVYSAPDLATVCERLRGTDVDYIQVSAGEKSVERFPGLNPALFPGEFVRVYSDAVLAYYDVDASCTADTVAVLGGS